MSNAASISAFKHAHLQQQVSTTVLRKTLDQAKAQGDAAVSLIEAAADVQKNAPTTKPQPLGPHQTISLIA